MRLFLLGWLLAGALTARAQPFTPAEVARWRQQAQRVTITRDTWGVAHVRGQTDADAVFGVLYAQCEDDFARVEDNYLTALGRQAEVQSEAALYQDLRQRLFLDSARAVRLYRRAPGWLKQLLQGFAAGTNYYLATHPATRPKRLRRFKPWYPLLFSEGSIGGNVSAVPLERLRTFYEGPRGRAWQPVPADPWGVGREPLGSNGFAIAPGRSASGHALLLINPHTTFYFRDEVQMTSAAGLDAYGAVTWGQFFIYQGFNARCGWMHTSSAADVMDEYLETVRPAAKGRGYEYLYAGRWQPLPSDTVSLRYLKDGILQKRRFTTYHTPHGPVVGEAGDKWLTVRMMNDPLAALSQSYRRTKATGYESFRQVMRLNGNASNNTVFADADGTIAYWHGNFMPRRPAGPDWSRPVDGSTPATEWQGLHPLEDLVQVRNPASGFIQNCNSTPFTVAGPGSSPDPKSYPAYMAPDPENYRGLNAVRVLAAKKTFTLDTLLAAANDPHLAAFDELLPGLLADYQLTVDAPGGTAPAGVAEAVEVLRAWNHDYDTAAVAQTLAIGWAERVQRLARPRLPADAPEPGPLAFTRFVIEHTTPAEKLQALADVQAELARDFGTWRQPWGQLNRYQRLTGALTPAFDDERPSRAVAAASSAWGSLFAYGSRAHPGTRRRYGTVGNSFVAVVEFGPRVVARAVTTGGLSSQPGEAHFTDQAPLHTRGQLREVWFYPDELARHTARAYRPGE